MGGNPTNRPNAHLCADKPDLAIEAPFEVWMGILTGKTDGTQMFLEGKYKAEGDISLMGMFGQ